MDVPNKNYFASLIGHFFLSSPLNKFVLLKILNYANLFTDGGMDETVSEVRLLKEFYCISITEEGINIFCLTK